MSLSKYAVGVAVPVTDVGRARDFYESKLGLSNPEEQGDGGFTYSCADGTSIHVYPSPDNAGKSGATLAFWEAGGEFEQVVDDLSSKGVSFEQYDMEGFKTDEKGIASFDGVKTAWFKDPDGNVLAVGHTT